MFLRAVGLMIISATVGACSTSPILRSSTPTSSADPAMTYAALGYYTLPRALVPATITFPACSTEQSKSTNGGCPPATLTVGAAIYVADSKHIYAIDAALSAYSSDNLTVEVDGDGFLKSIEANAKDETGSVIVKVADVIKGAATTVESFGTRLKFVEFSQPKTARAPTQAVSYPEIAVTALLDLSASNAHEVANFERRLIGPRLVAREAFAIAHTYRTESL